MGSQEGEISGLLSPSIYYGDCYAIEVVLSLIYAALRALKWRGKGFICLPSKTAFYCVTKWKRQARNGLLLTCLFLHPVWQLPYFSLLVDAVLWVAIIQQRYFHTPFLTRRLLKNQSRRFFLSSQEMTRYHCWKRRLKEVAAMKHIPYRQNPTVIDISKKARPPPEISLPLNMNCLII